MSILVLGLGNILLHDEGVGVHAVEALQQRHRLPPEVSVVDGGTCGMDLLEIIAAARHLIVVDAVKTGAAPGTLVRLAGDQVPAFFRTRISPHQLGLSELLATLTLHGEAPDTVTVIGCVPSDLTTGLGLSPGIATRLDDIVSMVAAELGRLGIPVTAGGWAVLG